MSRIHKAANLAMRRRRGSQETEARIQRSFMEADDLRSQCRFCHHVRHGTLEQTTGPCPACGAGIAKTHSD